jgi:hypothetical protein
VSNKKPVFIIFENLKINIYPPNSVSTRNKTADIKNNENELSFNHEHSGCNFDNIKKKPKNFNDERAVTSIPTNSVSMTRNNHNVDIKFNEKTNKHELSPRNHVGNEFHNIEKTQTTFNENFNLTVMHSKYRDNQIVGFDYMEKNNFISNYQKFYQNIVVSPKQIREKNRTPKLKQPIFFENYALPKVRNYAPKSLTPKLASSKISQNSGRDMNNEKLSQTKLHYKKFEDQIPALKSPLNSPRKLKFNDFILPEQTDSKIPTGNFLQLFSGVINQNNLEAHQPAYLLRLVAYLEEKIKQKQIL